MYNERKDTFSVKDIIVQVLCILLFIFLLLWLFPTKSFIKNNTNSNNYASNSETTVKVEESEQIVDAIFNFNVQTMKEAAISYYTTSRLPGKVGDTDKMTLRTMLSEKLILSFLDSDNKQCDLDNSYVEITILNDEYTLKVNLVCPASKSDYIIVHLGCYDYCKGNVCEKKTTTTKAKTYKCKYVDGKYWGSNYKVVDKATYEKQCKAPTPTPKPTPTPTPSVNIQCSVVNGVYYDNKGNVTNEANYNNVCNNNTTPTPVVTPTPTPTPTVNIQCSVVNGVYYDNKGNVTNQANYNNVCNTIIVNDPKYSCAYVDGQYWGKNYNKVDKATYEKECTTPEPTYTCAIVNGTYWGKNAIKVDKATYEKECLPPEPTYTCAIVNGVYWGKNATKVDKATYEKECLSPTPTPTPVTEYEYHKYYTVDGTCSWSNWSGWSKTKVTASSTVEVETKTEKEVSGTKTTCDTDSYDFVLSSDKKTCSIALKSEVVKNTYCKASSKGEYIEYNGACRASKYNDTKGELVSGTSGYYTGCTSDSEFTISATLYDSVPANTSKTVYKLYRQVTDPSCTTPNCNTKKYQVKVCTKKYVPGTSGYCKNSSYVYIDGHCYYVKEKTTEYSCKAISYKGKDLNGTYNSSTGKCDYTISSITENTYSKVTYYRSRTYTCTAGYGYWGPSVWSTIYNDSTYISQGYVMTGVSRTK